MELKFIQVDDLVIATAHIVSVDFSPGVAIMQLSNGVQHLFKATAAANLRKFFAAPEVKTDPAA